MIDLNIFALVVASIGAFILSGIWYAAFSTTLSKLHKAYAHNEKMSSLGILAELIRSLIVAIAVSFLIHNLSISSLGGALLYSLILWVAFPIVLLAGSVLHEKVPVKLAAIHAGDWLIKLSFITSLVTLWK